MKKLLAGLFCLGFAMSSYAATVTYNTTTNWSSKTVNDGDLVIINGGATVTLDTSDTAGTVRVSNGATDGALKINQNNTLVTTNFQLGTSTGSGVVTQSAGTVTAQNVQIGQGGTSAASRYYLSDGQLTSTETVTVGTNAQLNISGGKMNSSALTVNGSGAVNLTGGVLDLAGTLTAHGTVTINGGTVSNNIAGVGGGGRTIAGTDAVKMLSGDFVLFGGAATDVVKINVAKFEISGGNVDLGGQVLMAAGTEMKVVGDAATINVFRLNDLNTNTFRFVFNSSGISKIKSAGYVKLASANIIVDGSAYTGSDGVFNLFQGSVPEGGYVDTNNIHISGFDLYGGAHAVLSSNKVRLVVGLPYFTLAVTNGSGSGSYTNEQQIAIVASNAPAGMVFSQWTGDTAYLADSNSASTTVTMPLQAVSVTATYVDAYYHLLTVNNGSGSGSYTNGQQVEIVASNAPAGLVFGQWSGDTAYVAGIYAPTTTVTMGTQNISLTANYVVPTYTLTVNGGSGSGSYYEATPVPIVATNPPSGIVFDLWTGDTGALVSNKASTTVNMPASNITLTATYKSAAVTLTGEGSTGGSVSPTSTNVAIGGSATFTITASNYYRIATVTTNGGIVGGPWNESSTSGSYTWNNVQAAGTVSATFQYQVTTNPATSGVAVPTWWLAQYFTTNDYNACAVADQDGDGMKTWEEYIAGTLPNSAASVLKATWTTARSNLNVIAWSPVTGRLYSVYWSTNMVKGFTNLAGNIVYPQGSYTNTTPDGRVNYYQIKVRME